jgi:hypothetical protein
MVHVRIQFHSYVQEEKVTSHTRQNPSSVHALHFVHLQTWHMHLLSTEVRAVAASFIA